MRMTILPTLVLAAAMMPPAVASVRLAEEFARQMLSEVGAPLVECADEAPALPGRRRLVCGRLAQEDRAFRRAWDKAARSKQYEPMFAAPTSKWVTEGTLTTRRYDVDGTPVAVTRDGASGDLAVVISLDVEPCDESWRTLGPLLDDSGGAASGGITAPIRVKKVTPGLPKRAIPARGARVEPEVLVRSDGTVGGCCVARASPPHRGFEGLAVAAVLDWVYTPATLDGKPIAVRLPVVVSWTVH
jgi:hypothetical protein